MLPFVFAEAARRQRDSNDICNYNGSHISHNSHSSHGAQNNASQHYTTSNTVSYNQASTMPLGDLEAGHGQSTYPQLTPLPSYTGTPLPSTPPPSYNGLPLGPLPCAPAPNTLHPYVNHQIPRRPGPRPPRLSPRRRRCRGPCCGPGDHNCCTFLSCFLIITIAMVLFPLIAIRFKFGKDGHKGEESRVHCRGVVIVAAPAAHVGHASCG
jgi:hypothetical protein